MTLEAFKKQSKNIALFKNVLDNDEFVQDMFRCFRLRHFPTGRMIFKEGTSGSEMFIGLSGVVEIQRITRAGDSYTIRQISCENFFFGELALIDGAKRSATVVTKQPSSLLSITRNQFIKLCDRYPREGVIMLRILTESLASYLRQTNRNVTILFDALLNELE